MIVSLLKNPLSKGQIGCPTTLSIARYISFIVCMVLGNSMVVADLGKGKDIVTDNVPPTLEFKLDSKSVELGKRIYRQGILASGEVLTGLVQGDIPIKGTQLACIHCHKRSGFGGSEGNIVTPAITGDVLFSPQVSQAAEIFKLRNPDEKTRPAYDDATFFRAVVEGKHRNGRALDLLMPRYNLSESDRKNLLSYIKSLSSSPSPGVSKTEMQLAVIFTDSVSASQKRAALRILYRFIRTRNTDTRPHTRRAQNAPWHKKWHYESHRIWKLNLWSVEGPVETWASQLELQYGREPVFAVIGGLGNSDDWTPIDQFCESQEIPCLFPTTHLPPQSEQNFYSVYFSKGLVLEAEALAKHLSNIKKDNKALSIVQIYGNDLYGHVPAAVFRKKLSSRGFNNITDLVTKNAAGKLIDVNVLNNTMESADVIVYWVTQAQYGEWQKKITGPMVDAATYFSASLLNILKTVDHSKLVELYGENHLIYPYEKPELFRAKMNKMQRWMKLRKIGLVDAQIQANTLFSVKVLSRALKHIGSNFSRDYLIEKIEHLDQSVAISPVYPRMTFGPGQRFGSKGAYIARLQANEKEPIKIISDWIIP